MAQTAIIVPCRLESTRFPRKLLHQIKGRPLLLWVAERIAREAPEFPLWFAVDHELLGECVTQAGFKAIMTSGAHQSGTDRIAEANRTVKAEKIINVQADEPLVTGGQLRALAGLLADGAPMATLATPFKRAEDFANPNQVKVVLAPVARRALFFSRSPMPYARDRGGVVDDAWVAANPCYRHLGLYAYHASLLNRFAQLPLGRLEQIEKLEQLRVLENGYEIACDVTDDPTIGVDTPEDGAKFEQCLGGSRSRSCFPVAVSPHPARFARFSRWRSCSCCQAARPKLPCPRLRSSPQPTVRRSMSPARPMPASSN
ncbi:MAG: 3-deoxy-manno-octulosonate cytidylyltransferase [Verrucomicrobia bacterium]|nr:3-deoxy-manno-octulosonate cytidylyltransferase [Verrucomicrobiota bacterium]